MFTNILVALDGSKYAQEGLRVGAALAQKLGATLSICYVADTVRVAELTGPYAVMVGSALDVIDAEGKAILGQAAEFIQPQIAQTFLLSGFPPEQIVKCAKEIGADLIVMGSHGRSAVERFFTGSVTEAVLRKSHMPVFVTSRELAVSSATPPIRETIAVS